MNGKRERLQVIHDILKAVKQKNGKIKPTHIQYKANLSSQMLKEYLKDLIDRKLIIEQTEKRGKTYALTQKGFDYLRNFNMITDFMEMFGLNLDKE